MGNGYTRQSSADIQQGIRVDAPPLNAEFNAIRDAFDGTFGHSHDGTIGEGPKLDLGTSTSGSLAVERGGTGGTDAATARQALGLRPGTEIQAYDAGLQSIAGLTTAADKMIYTTALDVYATTALTPFARTILDDADATTLRTTIGVYSTTETNTAISTATGTKVSKAGDTMTGSLTSAVKDHGTLATTTEIFNYNDGNTHKCTVAGTVTINPTNLVEGGTLQVNFLFQSGAVNVSGTTQWDTPDGKSSSIADTQVTLVAGNAYRIVFELVAGVRTGVFK